jgi:hypothetical protein
MEVEDTLDHFHVVDNVAIFPLYLTIKLPNFSKLLRESGYDVDVTNTHIIAFAAVNSTSLITFERFDMLYPFGMAIFDKSASCITHLSADDDSMAVTGRILDSVSHSIKGDMYLEIRTNNPNFDVHANFFVKYGFLEPTISENKTIRMKYTSRPSTKQTLAQIRSLVASLKTNVSKLKVFIPLVVADTLSKYLSEINEAAGNLEIARYMQDEVAVLGLDSDNIINGSEGDVTLPEKYSPFVFHTHPDHINRKTKSFLSWPSGQDMMLVAYSYIEKKDQLMHLVPSHDGIWVIHVTTEFQKLLVLLRANNLRRCAEGILTAIRDVFVGFETPRQADVVAAIDRHTIAARYLALTKTYTLTRLVKDVPSLQEACVNFTVAEDAQLYNVSLIKWKRFSETYEKGVHLTFDYNVDHDGRLPPYFIPKLFY